MVERNKDYLRECNTPAWKIADAQFTSEICTQCVRAECVRSAYRDSATKKKIEHNLKISQYMPPEADMPVSPLSNYPEEATPAPALQVQGPTIEKPSDPWTVPKDERYIDYREIADPKKDPWSPDYDGPRELRIKPGETVVVGGKHSNVPPKKTK